MSDKAKGVWTRIGSGIVLAVILAVFILLGGYFFFGFCLLLSVLGAYEFYRLFSMQRSPAAVLGMIFGIAVFVLNVYPVGLRITPVVVLCVITFGALYVFRFGKTDRDQMMKGIFGVFYPFYLFSFFAKLRLLNGGLYLICLLLICAFGSDIFAYVFGMLFGKHKMAPVLSPKKSWEGFFGGTFSAVLLAFLFGFLFRNEWAGSFRLSFLPETLRTSTFIFPLAALFTVPMGVIGDLFASAFKRETGIKDYSNLIPGHGGILDRFDSVLFAAPVLYYLIRLFVA